MDAMGAQVVVWPCMLSLITSLESTVLSEVLGQIPTQKEMERLEPYTGIF